MVSGDLHAVTVRLDVLRDIMIELAAVALCRFVWNLTSQPMGADAGQFRQCGNKR